MKVNRFSINLIFFLEYWTRYQNSPKHRITDLDIGVDNITPFGFRVNEVYFLLIVLFCKFKFLLHWAIHPDRESSHVIVLFALLEIVNITNKTFLHVRWKKILNFNFFGHDLAPDGIVSWHNGLWIKCQFIEGKFNHRIAIALLIGRWKVLTAIQKYSQLKLILEFHSISDFFSRRIAGSRCEQMQTTCDKAAWSLDFFVVDRSVKF